jgi:pantoate--beta-alanine ligase
MQIFKTKTETTNFILKAKSQGKTIGFVPTMGALHSGHMSLISLAKKNCDIVICSIFVNPTQFSAGEDFDRYPRTEQQDCSKLSEFGCDIVFIPDTNEIYDSLAINEKPIITHDDILCGAFRKGHFQGVVQVLKKLFDIILPDTAFFGEKDFQQCFIIKKNFPKIKIIIAPTIRDNNGLALSSRNKYLSETELKIAKNLNLILKKSLNIAKNNNISLAIEFAKNEILSSGFDKIDYVEFRESDTLESSKTFSENTRVFAAVWLNKTRLIDNIKL